MHLIHFLIVKMKRSNHEGINMIWKKMAGKENGMPLGHPIKKI